MYHLPLINPVDISRVSKESDIWYIGLIMGELLKKEPIFPGTSLLNQLERIFQLLGIPSLEDFNSANTKFTPDLLNTFDKNMKFQSFSEVFPNASDETIDLLSRMLQFNPHKRIDTLSALQHPYLKDFYDENDVKVFENPIQTILDGDENVSDYRSKITKDIVQRLSQITKDKTNKEQL